MVVGVPTGLLASKGIAVECIMAKLNCGGSGGGTIAAGGGG